MQNNAIRKMAKESGVKLWEIAFCLGISDGNFSRKLRKELPEDEQERVFTIIHELAEDREVP